MDEQQPTGEVVHARDARAELRMEGLDAARKLRGRSQRTCVAIVALRTKRARVNHASVRVATLDARAVAELSRVRAAPTAVEDAEVELVTRTVDESGRDVLALDALALLAPEVGHKR